ncbi:PpiC-type peptidyl-prolyl cis-trans isomerase [Thermobaculum terrenum ATCC BAA-798]|uniref:PpiC-type peptidyl-prolyl cis-trans isomerase n=1 Tax=Thermobaculum terrenum (strain ATCC BAA-798 / CCMEE 7001 / YNP1) TaxID=525904 RepID=D1CFJ2_THET1|nr:peptidylprolyl isomerase [Thermobaculum terrenum]ACZ41698.1 PpiC-type peptidyl-prolyl cis-trans isomerase [Thermobaculum terrenum ATCC BAA-798]
MAKQVLRSFFDRFSYRRYSTVSRVDREYLLQRLIISVVAIALLIVVLIIAVPLIKQYLWEPSRTLAVVGNERIRKADYDQYVKMQVLGITDAPESLASLYQVYKTDPESFPQRVKDAINSSMFSTSDVDAYTLDQMINNLVLNQTASKLGINISDQEVQAKIREIMSVVGASATPTSLPTTTTPSATSTPQAKSTPRITPTAATLPSDYQNFVSSLQKSAGISMDMYASMLVRPALIRQRYLETKVPKSAEQVHVRHILVSTKQQAEEVIKELRQGKKFEVIAKEKSIDDQTKLKGGDLGWAPRGIYEKSFEDAAFALTKVGQISPPVQTSYGWHVIQLLGREKDRPLTETQRQQLGQYMLQQFIQEQRQQMQKSGDLKVNIPPTPTPISSPTPTVTG